MLFLKSFGKYSYVSFSLSHRHDNFNMGTEISILCFCFSAGGGNDGWENGTREVVIDHSKYFLFLSSQLVTESMIILL